VVKGSVRHCTFNSRGKNSKNLEFRKGKALFKEKECKGIRAQGQTVEEISYKGSKTPRGWLGVVTGSIIQAAEFGELAKESSPSSQQAIEGSIVV